jgi:four helix bundle protein
MTDFGYEKLIVYRKSLAFYSIGKTVLDNAPRKVAACDHLNRASESIPLNIAHASSCWSAAERIGYLGYANGSALECAACLDVFVAKSLLTAERIRAAKRLLHEIVAMLIALKNTASDRLREVPAAYKRDTTDALFSHERLDVYQAALQLVAWIEELRAEFGCSADLLAKLDRASTAIPLNIAEGNGRFGGTDQARFLGIAYKSTVQTASLVDLATMDHAGGSEGIDAGRKLLRRIAVMLSSLSKATYP